MAYKKAVHPRYRDSPELEEPSIDGSLVAEMHDLVHATRELEAHVLGHVRFVVFRPRKFQRGGEHPDVFAIGGDVSGEETLDRLGEAEEGIVEMGVCGEGLAEPGEEFELDHLAKAHGEGAVVRRK